MVETTNVPGSARFAHSLSSAETAELLRRELPAVAAHRGRLLVCGGGLTGIEAASELAETYPELQATLLTAGTFGEQFSRRGQEHLHEVLARLGIAVVDGQQITAVHGDHVETGDGSTIPFDVCLWAGSFRAPALARESGLPVNDRDQVLVDEYLPMQGWPNHYAVGDAASLEKALSMTIRMGCVTATPMGTYAGTHLAARIKGEETEKPFRFHYLKRCISLGRKNGFVVLAIASWYATLFHYQAWGWIVTGFTTVIGIVGLFNLIHWSSHRQKTGATIDTRPRTRTAVDLVILLLGLLFAYLALFVF